MTERETDRKNLTLRIRKVNLCWWDDAQMTETSSESRMSSSRRASGNTPSPLWNESTYNRDFRLLSAPVCPRSWHFLFLWRLLPQFLLEHRCTPANTDTQRCIDVCINKLCTFVTAARPPHFDVLLLPTGRRAQLTLVGVGDTVSAANLLCGLTHTLRALTLILDAASTPTTHSVATGLCEHINTHTHHHTNTRYKQTLVHLYPLCDSFQSRHQSTCLHPQVNRSEEYVHSQMKDAMVRIEGLYFHCYNASVKKSWLNVA